MWNTPNKNGITPRFRWAMILYTIFIVGVILYILAGEWFNYPPNPTVRTYHDNLLFPIWVLMVGYEFGVKRTTKRLTQRWKN